MNKEIKEILDKLLKYLKESNINDFGYEKDKLISYEEAQIILDYITNLEQENENLHIKLEDKANEQIKTMYEEYKSRIDKAITYMEMMQQNGIADFTDIENLLNILKGDNK